MQNSTLHPTPYPILYHYSISQSVPLLHIPPCTPLSPSAFSISVISIRCHGCLTCTPYLLSATLHYSTLHSFYTLLYRYTCSSPNLHPTLCVTPYLAHYIPTQHYSILHQTILHTPSNITPYSNTPLNITPYSTQYITPYPIRTPHRTHYSN